MFQLIGYNTHALRIDPMDNGTGYAMIPMVHTKSQMGHFGSETMFKGRGVQSPGVTVVGVQLI